MKVVEWFKKLFKGKEPAQGYDVCELTDYKTAFHIQIQESIKKDRRLSDITADCLRLKEKLSQTDLELSSLLDKNRKEIIGEKEIGFLNRISFLEKQVNEALDENAELKKRVCLCAPDRDRACLKKVVEDLKKPDPIAILKKNNFIDPDPHAVYGESIVNSLKDIRETLDNQKIPTENRQVYDPETDTVLSNKVTIPKLWDNWTNPPTKEDGRKDEWGSSKSIVKV